MEFLSSKKSVTKKKESWKDIGTVCFQYGIERFSNDC